MSFNEMLWVEKPFFTNNVSAVKVYFILKNSTNSSNAVGMVKRLINIILLIELLLYIHSHTGTKTSSKLEPNIKNANQKSIFDVNIVFIIIC